MNFIKLWCSRVLFLLLVNPAIAQNQDTLFHYFSYFSMQPDINTAYTGTVIVDNYYYVIGVKGLNQEQVDLYCDKFNNRGELVWSRILDDSANEDKNVKLGSTILYEEETNSIIVPYSLTNFLYPSVRMAFIKMDTAGNVLVSKKYNHPSTYNNVYVQNICRTASGGYLLLGNQQLVVNGVVYAPHIYVRNVNNMGELIWAREYYPVQENRTVAASICPTPDGNYFIGGAMQYEPFNGDGLLHYLIKINEAGDTLFTRTFGLPVGDLDNNNNGALGIQQFNDSLLLVAMNEYSNALFQEQGQVVQKTFFANSNFDIFDENIDTIDLREIWFPYILEPDNSFTAVRNIYNENNFQEGHFYKMDAHRDSLYRKRVGYENTFSYAFHDFDKCPDGGYLITGYTAPLQPQRGFLFKIDSLGNYCSAWGCDSVVLDTTSYISYLQEFQEGRHTISTAPNPCSEHFTLSYNLPREAENCWFRLFDAKGIERRSLRLSEAIGSKEVQLSHCEAGIYYWKLVIGNRVIDSGKLVVR